MTSLKKPFLLLLAIAAAFTYFAITNDSSELLKEEKTKQDIIALNKKLTEAYVNADLTTLEEMLSDDHVHNNVFGMVMDKKKFLGDISTKTLVFKSYETPKLEIKVYGDVCVTTGLIEAEAYRAGNEVKGPFTFTRIYKKQPNGNWQVTLFHNTMVRAPGTV